jgi:hypothetical protein
MANHKVKNKQSKSQSVAFVDAARALECDESEERFDAALKKVAAHKPHKDGGNSLLGNTNPSKGTASR